MSEIILDLGSGNSCKNSIDYACRMVREVAEIGFSNVVIKWQLFKHEGDNVPLSLEIFERAYHYAEIYGIRTTASVFDKDSLDYLLTFSVPFVKIANKVSSQMLIKDIPDGIRVIYSTDKPDFKSARKNTDVIYCVSKYPAEEKDYDKFGDKLKQGMSDHTSNFNLYRKFRPAIYECHFKLKDTIGNDSGSFARLPEDFKYMNVEPKKEVSEHKEAKGN